MPSNDEEKVLLDLAESSLGVHLSTSPLESKTLTIESIINKGKQANVPHHALLGATNFAQLPAEILHRMALYRNHRVVEMAREYAELVGATGRLFDDTSASIHLGIQRPKLDADMRETQGLGEHIKPYTSFLAQAAGLHKVSSRYINYKDTSFVASFLIPTLVVYQRFYENKDSSNLASRSESSRDYDAWKDFILREKTLATRFFSRPLTAHLHLESLKRHAYVVGGTGSGKTELMKLFVHHIVREQKAQGGELLSGLILDPHGDFSEEVARFQECEGNDRIIYFNPTLSEYESPAIDIFSLVSQDERELDICASNLAYAFDEIVADSSLSSQMRTLLVPCISVLLRREGSSLHDLQRFMLDEHNDDLVELGRQLENPSQSSFFHYGFHEKAYTPTKRAIYTRLQTLLNARVFSRIVNPKATLNLEQALANGKLVVMNLAHGALGKEVSSAFGRLVMALVKNAGFRRQALPKTRRPQSFIFVDECQNFVGDSMRETLEELRKFGVHLVLANQVVGQGMTTELTRAILGNTGAKFVGSSGNHTRAAMAKEMGLSTEQLSELSQGIFYTQIHKGKSQGSPFRFKAPSHLVGNSGGIVKERWYEQKKRGWAGYVANKQLDQKPSPPSRCEPQAAPENPSSSSDAPKFEL